MEVLFKGKKKYEMKNNDPEKITKAKKNGEINID